MTAARQGRAGDAAVPSVSAARPQGNVSKLLPPQLQAILLQQAQYLDRCAGLATLLRSPDDAPLAGALDKVNAVWHELLSANEAVQSGLALFMLFHSTNAPPSRSIWCQLGSVALSLVVRRRACRLSFALLGRCTLSPVTQPRCTHIHAGSSLRFPEFNKYASASSP